MPDKPIKMVSWNVNGLRAVWEKGFLQSVNKLDPDILAVQETKLQEPQLTDEMRSLDGYESFWSFASTKKGYSGVGVYTKLKPVNVNFGIGIPRFDNEGRILELDFGNFIFFNIYFPNGQMSDERLQYKLDFYQAFFQYADQYKKAGKNIIITGDYNTAHNEIDLKNPKANQKRSGFLRIERDWIDRIIENGYVDTFRYLYPDKVKYSWWSYRFKAREKNAGWRIDYFFTTKEMVQQDMIKDAFIDNDVFGSDHCPVGLTINLTK
ncbi:Exodeoxyribonuclease [Desulfonema limicola]|uniref:Exodeoxyribonuclease n=1 Tax=Desulfonema limicola TaxID=45656 RepID=A0A975B676_9BACT|nr:exodeoxyribonuclease III [Desulfonema limicola]QTA79507.1 Exodeoxyribonuclease [Desulfonema limicola]